MKRAPSMNGGRRIRLKTQAEKVARRLRRQNGSGAEDCGMSDHKKLKMLPSRLLSVDEIVEEFEGKERSMLLDIVRGLRQSDLAKNFANSSPTSPRDHDDHASKRAERLLQLDLETLNRIAGKTQQQEPGPGTPLPAAKAPATNGEDGKGAPPAAAGGGKDGHGQQAARSGGSGGSGATWAPLPPDGSAIPPELTPPHPSQGAMMPASIVDGEWYP